MVIVRMMGDGSNTIEDAKLQKSKNIPIIWDI